MGHLFFPRECPLIGDLISNICRDVLIETGSVSDKVSSSSFQYKLEINERHHIRNSCEIG